MCLQRQTTVHHNEPVLKAIAKYRGVMRGKNNKEAAGVLYTVPGWIRGGDRASVSLSHYLTFILILPLSSPTDFSTRIFSSFRSRCTMSVRCEEDNIHSDIVDSNTWTQATIAFTLMTVINIHMNIQMLTVDETVRELCSSCPLFLNRPVRYIEERTNWSRCRSQLSL